MVGEGFAAHNQLSGVIFDDLDDWLPSKPDFGPPAGRDFSLLAGWHKSSDSYLTINH